MPNVAIVIFVGGKARRLEGQNKSGLMLGSKSCLERTLDVVKGYTDKIAMSVGPTDRYDHAKDHEVIYDWPSKEGERGVAHAILGSMAWAKESGFEAIITTPVDTPLLPTTFVPMLLKENSADHPTVCKTFDGLQGLHAIWPTSCLERVKTTIIDDQYLKISQLHKVLSSKELLFPEIDRFRFLNINDEAALHTARQYFLK